MFKAQRYYVASGLSNLQQLPCYQWNYRAVPVVWWSQKTSCNIQPLTEVWRSPLDFEPVQPPLPHLNIIPKSARRTFGKHFNKKLWNKTIYRFCNFFSWNPLSLGICISKNTAPFFFNILNKVSCLHSMQCCDWKSSPLQDPLDSKSVTVSTDQRATNYLLENK